VTLGRWGEEVSSSFLKLKGLTVVARNYRIGRYEIDIVARDGDVIVFVAVKVRCDPKRGGAVGAVGFKKQRDLARAAAGYLANTSGSARPCRFDVVAITVDREGRGLTLRHIENAFGCSPSLGFFG